MKYSLSPIVFNDMYGGEDYDARLKSWQRKIFIQKSSLNQ